MPQAFTKGIKITKGIYYYHRHGDHNNNTEGAQLLILQNLAELTQEEASEWKKETAGSSAVMLSGFQQTLIDTWQKRKRGE